jgi:hypothetical protein
MMTLYAKKQNIPPVILLNQPQLPGNPVARNNFTKERVSKQLTTLDKCCSRRRRRNEESSEARSARPTGCRKKTMGELADKNNFIIGNFRQCLLK